MAVVATACAVVAANTDLRSGFGGLFGSPNRNLIPYKVKKQKLVITVTERGNLESAKNIDVANEVEGQTTIISILPEGTRVKKGELVAELDSAALEDNRVNQEIATKRAEADLENARKTREVAEIAVKEYEQGTYPQSVQDIKGEQTLAQSERVRANERLAWSEAMLKNKYVSESQVIADRLTKLKADISLEQSQRKMKVLQDFTSKKQMTELLANVEKAKSDELAKQQTHDLEKSKLDKLKRQISKTKLFAPADGLIVYVNETNQFRGNNAPLIEEGAMVRERQKIFSLPDITHMQVNTKVHESMVDRVKREQKAKIRVDAFPNEPLTGTVKSVAPLPDPSNFFSSDIKVYATIVTIDQSFTALRPGMTAEVTIHIDTVEDALCIPVTANLSLGGKDYVYLITPEGPVRREIKLGDTNDVLLEVKEGLKEGDLVAMNPASLLTDEERRQAFSATARAGAQAKDFGDAKPVSPGLEGAKGKGGPEGKDKAKRKRGGGGGMAVFAKIQAKTSKLPPEEQEKLKDFSLPMEDRMALMKKAGVTDEELQEMQQAIQERMQNGGGFGGGGGPGGGGPGGGGPGGGGFGGGPPGGGGGPGGGGFRGGPGGGAPQ